VSHRVMTDGGSGSAGPDRTGGGGTRSEGTEGNGARAHALSAATGTVGVASPADGAGGGGGVAKAWDGLPLPGAFSAARAAGSRTAPLATSAWEPVDVPRSAPPVAPGRGAADGERRAFRAEVVPAPRAVRAGITSSPSGATFWSVMCSCTQARPETFDVSCADFASFASPHRLLPLLSVFPQVGLPDAGTACGGRSCRAGRRRPGSRCRPACSSRRVCWRRSCRVAVVLEAALPARVDQPGSPGGSSAPHSSKILISTPSTGLPTVPGWSSQSADG
jgi:hypothetical protein